MESNCKICGNLRNNRKFYVREMMFGYGDVFEYFQCSKCECLQIAEYPKQLAEYYPSNYHPSRSGEKQTETERPMRRFLRVKRNEAELLRGTFTGKILKRIFRVGKDRVLDLNSLLDFNELKKRDLTFSSRILDVGCGHGTFLNWLYSVGFRNLLGIDPFIEKDILFDTGIGIKKKWIHDIKEQFDLIVFNHSFEHMPDPFEVLQSVSRILSRKGVCLIRIPIVCSYAWQKYGVNWVQLDAPRHFFLHSFKSMNVLIERAELKLQAIIQDSTDFQFWGSEQYMRNIPLRSEHSYWINPGKSVYSLSDIAEFKQKARELNDKELGDQAAFYICK